MPVYTHDELVVQKLSENLTRRLAYLNKIMVTICDFSNGPMDKPDPFHSHPHEQISYVAKGELFVLIGDEKHRLKEGDVFTVPSGVPHTVQILSAHVRLIDSFTPIRKDLLK